MIFYEGISAFLSAVSAVAAVAGFTGLRRQLQHAEQAEERERARVRQQATLELVMEKFFEVRDVRESLRPLLLRDADPKLVRDQIIRVDTASHGSSPDGGAGDHLGERVRRYMTYLEFLAIGVDKGILDRDVVYEMSGKHFLNVYRCLYLYILHAQRDDRKGAYANFVKLVRNWYPDKIAEVEATRE